jgi:hypothetical protein
VRTRRNKAKEPGTGAAAGAALADSVTPTEHHHAAINGEEARGSAEVKGKASKIPFWELVNSLGDKWATDDYKIYLYRKWPVIDRGDSDHFIAKLREPIDPDFLLKTFGSGKYSLQLNDGQGKVVAYKVESVHHPDHPPKLNPAEVTRDPQNDVYWAVWGKTASSPKSGKEETAKIPDIAEILRAHSEGQKIDPTVVSWLQDMANRRDDLAAKLAEASAKNPTTDLSNLIGAVKSLMPPQAPAASSDKSEILAIITALKAMQPNQPDPLAVLRQAKDLFAAPERNAEPARNHIAELDQILGFAQKLSALRVTNSGGDRSGWDVGLDFVRELGPNIVQPTLQFISNLMVLNKGGVMPQPAGTPGATPMPTAFDPYSRPDLLRQHAQNLNRQAATTTAGANPPAAPNQEQGAPAGVAPAGMEQGSSAPPAGQGTAAPNELLTLLQSYGGLILGALNNGTPGYEFADNVARLFGTATVAMISTHGEQLLADTMLSVPELAMFGESRLRRFCHEFVHFEEFLEGNEDDEHSSTTETRTGA